LQHSTHLAKAERGILEVSQSECDGNSIEGIGPKRNRKRVRLDTRYPAIELPLSDLQEAAHQHGMTKVRSDDAYTQKPMQFDCEIRCSAAKIETQGCGVFTHVLLYFRGCEATPPAIDGNRKNVIQEIVAVGDSRRTFVGRRRLSGPSGFVFIDEGFYRLLNQFERDLTGYFNSAYGYRAARNEQHRHGPSYHAAWLP
jgi:hypothetical protein